MDAKEKAELYDKAIEIARKNYKAAENLCDGSKIGVECFKYTLSSIFPELKEGDEDEVIRKAIIDFFNEPGRKKYILNGFTVNGVIAWLEKQGKQNPYGQRKECLDCQFNYASECKGSCQMKRDEQITDDKIKPKFHEGDFIKHNKANIICKVISVNSGSYYVENIVTSGRIELFNAEQNFHLWTIKDAKDGDVLINKNYMGESPFIFKETKPSNIKTDVPNPLTVLGYCGIGGAGFTKSSGWGDTANCIYYPATKSQRGTLLKAMADARYTFDFEKKELKKIEQKPTWSKEDERMLDEIIDFFENGTVRLQHDLSLYAFWLKSLKPHNK